MHDLNVLDVSVDLHDSATPMKTRPHHISACCDLPGQASKAASVPVGINAQRIEAAVREILLAIGEDPDRAGLIETPARVARAYCELFAGLHEDPGVHLGRVFAEQTGEVILCRGIEFHSMCEHHLLPFSGRAHVAYIPNGREVLGLSKLARTVDVFARRPQVQERMTNQIADALVEHLDPVGVAVMIEAEHMCMKMRGAGKQHSDMVTSAMRGVFASDPAQRREIVALMQGGSK
jgi:GTP cyclohydrolase I